MTQTRTIAEALLAALNGSGKPAGVPTAKLWSGIQLEPHDLPARTVAWVNESVERAGSTTSPLVRRSVTFIVQDLFAGTGHSALSPQQIAEAARAWSVAALATNTYSGLAIDTVEKSTSWDLEQGEEPYVRVSHEFEVTFTTRTTNAESRA
jgi:hypothetical protein